MRCLLLACLVVASCSREPIPVAPDGAPPSLEDDNYYGRWHEASAPDAGAPDRARAPDASSLPPPPPKTCKPGQRLWCSSVLYSGWGLADCDPVTGRWRETLANGQAELDCREQPTGERPNTLCACYHFFFNPSCCERPGCVLEPGESGALCPASKGALCDYCNPQKPECTEPGAICVVTNTHATFCARHCSSSDPCPGGYQCMVVKLKTGSTNQCVPSDYSCYH
jgi:hypothetical protein